MITVVRLGIDTGITEWLARHVGTGKWHYRMSSSPEHLGDSDPLPMLIEDTYYHFFFEDLTHALMFKLTWGGQ